MALVEPVVAQLIMNTLLTRHGRVDGRRKAEWFLFGFSAFLLAVGTVYLFLAFHATLTESFSPSVAGLITAAAAFGAAGLSALVALAIENRRSAERHHTMETAGESLFAALDAATAGLEEPIANNPRTAVLMASLAGFMTANKLH